MIQVSQVDDLKVSPPRTCRVQFREPLQHCLRRTCPALRSYEGGGVSYRSAHLLYPFSNCPARTAAADDQSC